VTVKREIRTMGITEALEYVKKTCKAKFDSTIEVHINCLLDRNKQETIRFNISLPHGTGKNKKIAVISSKKIVGAGLELSEDDIKKIENGILKPKVDFDILLAEPRFMPKLAKIAKILGPAGIMPNPKNGTVSEDIQNTLEQFKKGRVEVRTEANGTVIHTVIGKKSFTTKALQENFQELISALNVNKPLKAQVGWIKKVFISATMSPSVEVSV
jgi:large subunit ribosomal protein L1